MSFLDPKPRRTVRIELKSYPGEEFYILKLNVPEFFAMGTALNKKPQDISGIGVQMEHMLCDAAGNLLLKPGDGDAFIRNMDELHDASKLREIIDTTNSLTDKAVEATEKN